MNIVSTILIVILPSLFGFGNRAALLNKKATTLYKQNKYDEALEQYRKAQVQSPDSDILHYNIGCTLYKKGAYDEAEKGFADVASSLKAKKLWAKAYYNLGNALFRKGKLDDAIEAYKRALRINPNDMDAKYNLELAQKVSKQSKAKQSQEQKEERKQQSEKRQQEGKKPQQQKSQEEREEKKFTKEDIDRILSAAREEEKKAKQKSEKRKTAGQIRVFKDW
ncbi:MAG TPA: tetratricopeptide repeat protein [bacterium (Candidatus Stahlbacteria)]|nr:tetratricopeptide repeat protein [Candidatus Stahlbacteria bacterium]